MKKKLLCVHQGYELYGSDRSFVRSVKAIREQFQDLEITVVLPRKGLLAEYLYDYVDNLEINDLGVLRKSDFNKKWFKNTLHLLSNILSAIKYIREFDFLYINSIVAIGCIITTIFSKRPSIIHVREIPTGLFAIFFSMLLKASHSNLIFNSRTTQNSFYFLKENRCKVIYNGVKGFQFDDMSSTQSKTLNILLIGRFNSCKGQAFLLNALGQIDTNYLKQISVRLVGDYFEGQKQYYDKILELREQLHLEGGVEICPFAEDPSIHYAWSHIVVVPSTKPESFGLVAIEGMSAGRPIIGTNHGGLSEIIKNRETGILIEPENFKEFNDAIIYFLNSHDSIIEFGKAGKIRFNNLFNEDIYTNAIKRYFLTFLKN